MKIIAAVVIVAVLATGAYAVTRGSDNGSNNTPAQSATPESSTPEATTGVSGQYLDYTPNIIAHTSGTKLLYFHAPWCPQCRELEADIKAKGVPDGVSIIKIDYDSNQALRQKYGVTIQTTLVKVDDQGNLLKKYVAYDEPNLESVERNLL